MAEATILAEETILAEATTLAEAITLAEAARAAAQKVLLVEDVYKRQVYARPAYGQSLIMPMVM